MLYLDKEDGQIKMKSEGPQIIKIKKFNKDIPDPLIIKKGDWIDLYASEDFELKKGERKLVKLGVGMILPDGMEGWLLPRSGTPKEFMVLLANSMGVIDGGDEGYNGETDEWRAHILPFQDTHIKKGERFVQFRVFLSQKATAQEKYKWECSDGVKLEFVDHLRDKSRGGISSTGTGDLNEKK